jgi:flagellar biosynthesis anti-sigma factor FlgM
MSINGLGVVNIDFNKQVDNDGTGKASVAKTQTSPQLNAGEEYTTSFTSARQTVQSLSQAAIATSPSRQIKVEALKQAVSSAQYQVDSDKIAESLVNADV